MSQQQPKKPTREEELRGQVVTKQREIEARMYAATNSASMAESKALTDSLTLCNANGKATKEKVAAHGAQRVRRIHEAELAYTKAIRLAESERQKRHNEVNRDFAQARDDLEKQLVETNAPIRAEYERKSAQIASALKDCHRELARQLNETLEPLLVELTEIEAKKKAAEPPAKDAA